jgi:putative nucleotidyltransferase with HDIG domain
MNFMKRKTNNRSANGLRARRRNRTSQSKTRKTRPEEYGPSPWTASALYKWILGFLVVAILTVLAPEHLVFRPVGLPREGDISKTDIIAPFTFFVMKDDAQLQAEREAAAREILPLYDYDATVLPAQRERIARLFQEIDQARSEGRLEGQFSTILRQQLSEETLEVLGNEKKAGNVKEAVRQISESILKLGIVPGDSLSADLPASPVRIRRGDMEYRRNPQELLTEDRASKVLLKEIRQRFDKDDLALKATYELAVSFLKPNLKLNDQETERRRRETMEAVPTTKGMVLKDEKIIGSHERVTKTALEKLRSLVLAKEERESLGRSWSLLFPIAGRLLFNVFVVALVAAYLFFYRPRIYTNNRLLLLLALVMLGQMFIAYLVQSVAGASEYLVPIAIAAMLTTILFDAELGGVMALAIALLFGNLEGFDLATTLVALIVGTAAAYSVTKVRHRREFYRPMLFISSGYIFSIGFIGMMRLIPAGAIIKDFGLGVLSGVGTPIITSGMLFIFEGIFHVTTDITLLELSDTNRPLLRELSLRAPGTYHHSMNVGYLAETAAEAIGAHSLLARVASYYHDIGKLEKPEYFVENQRRGTRNPHDRLAPSMSGLILAAHIKDGIELAKEARLPRSIIDIIQQHHGTSLMSFFYRKAIDQGSGREVEEAYRYPGPRPETKEAAIIMLADGVEAASRTLEEKTPGRIKGMVGKIVQEKFSSGQLDNCELSLKDLHQIEVSFVRVLGATYHQRVEYPSAVDDRMKAERREHQPVANNGHNGLRNGPGASY